MEFNERLRVSRKEKGLTQVDLAEKAGIAVNSVRLYESGKVTPKLDAMRKLADALEIDINWLLNGYTLEEHNEKFIQRLQMRYQYISKTIWNFLNMSIVI